MFAGGGKKQVPRRFASRNDKNKKRNDYNGGYGTER